MIPVEPVAPVEPVVSVVFLDRTLVEADLVATVLSAVECKGFDVVGLVDVDGLLDVDGPRHHDRLASARFAVAPARPAIAAILVDVHPLRRGKGRSKRVYLQVGNHRLATLASLERRLRSVWSELVPDPGCLPPGEGALLSWWEPEPDGWEGVRRLEPAAEAAARADVEARRAWITPPFPVLAELSGFAISSRTDLVSFAGSTAVCRTFRQGRERAFANEVDCYRLADEVEGVAKPLAVGRNWVVVPFHVGYRPLDEAFGSRMPISMIRRALEIYAEASARGLGLLDYGLDNVLVGPDGRLTAIDFEHVHRYPGPPPPLQESPLGLGASYFDGWQAEHGLRKVIAEDVAVLKSYERHWRPFTGAPLGELLASSDLRLNARRYPRILGPAIRRRAARLRRP